MIRKTNLGQASAFGCINELGWGALRVPAKRSVHVVISSLSHRSILLRAGNRKEQAQLKITVGGGRKVSREGEKLGAPRTAFSSSGYCAPVLSRSVCVPTRLGYVDARIVDSTGSTKLHRGGTLTARLKTGARQCRRLPNDGRAEFFALPDYFAATSQPLLAHHDVHHPVRYYHDFLHRFAGRALFDFWCSQGQFFQRLILKILADGDPTPKLSVHLPHSLYFCRSQVSLIPVRSILFGYLTGENGEPLV